MLIATAAAWSVICLLKIPSTACHNTTYHSIVSSHQYGSNKFIHTCNQHPAMKILSPSLLLTFDGKHGISQHSHSSLKENMWRKCQVRN